VYALTSIASAEPMARKTQGETEKNDTVLQYVIRGAMCIDLAIIVYIGKDVFWKLK